MTDEIITVELDKVCAGSPDEVYRLLGTSRYGLTQAEAEQRLEKYGPNVLEAAARTPLWKKFLGHLFNTFANLLWVAAILSLLSDQAALAAAVVVINLLNASLALFQEFRAEKAIEALANLLPAKAKVVRDGELREIPASTLVPGDVISVEEGDAISADSRLVGAANLRVNNSSLTGEAEPVARRADASCISEGSVTDNESFIFTGTSAALGSGRAVVFATGMRTEFGKIATLTQSVGERPSPLQRNVARLSRYIALIAVGLGILFFLMGFFLVHLTILDASILAIGIIVANVPEGLLPTLTMALSVATQRMADRHVLIKKLASVETLGSVTTICTDKTGTLTQNEMTVREVYLPGRRVEVEGVGYEPLGGFVPTDKGTLSAEEQTLLDACLLGGGLCNNSQLRAPDEDHEKWYILGDPTEAAMLVAAAKGGHKPEELFERKRVWENPFDSSRKRMSVMYDEGGTEVAYVKGAPREIVERCTRVMTPEGPRELSAEERERVLTANDDYALEALRVIAVAMREVDGADYRDVEAIENDLTLLGLEAMQDPPRAEVADAIVLAHKAGIRVIMITGDYGLTAESIARKIGLVSGPDVQVITGNDLEHLNDDELRERLREPEVLFARVVPEHKMRIAQALQAVGETVAMTGDGVNDAPALKAADIGIAMGIAGTDVARESADMILTDDNFASIVGGVEEGRAIFDNIRRFLTYFQTSNVAEMIPFLFFVFGHVPLPLTLLQILTIDLLTDQVPAIALGLEKPEPGIMLRPPRKIGEPLLNTGMVLKAYLFLGPLAAAIGMFGFFYRYWEAGWRFSDGIAATAHFGPTNSTVYLAATTMTLTGIVMAQVGNGFALRTHRETLFKIGLFSNRLLMIGIAAELIIQAALVYVPWLQHILGTAPLTGTEWLVLAAFAPTLFVADEIRKFIVRSRFGPAHPTPTGGKAG